MRISTISGVIFAWIIGTNCALAQVDVRPEPNVLLPDAQDWRLSVGGPAPTADAAADHGVSILTLCANRVSDWPATLRDACKNLLLEAVAAESARLGALSRLRKTLGEEQAAFRVRHLQRTLENQARQGNVVFWLMIVVVCVGMLSAVAQFVRAYRAGEPEGSAELAISSNEFKFRTTWLGALLLGMSMGFLALYLFFIYPVHVL